MGLFWTLTGRKRKTERRQGRETNGVEEVPFKKKTKPAMICRKCAAPVCTSKKPPLSPAALPRCAGDDAQQRVSARSQVVPLCHQGVFPDLFFFNKVRKCLAEATPLRGGPLQPQKKRKIIKVQEAKKKVRITHANTNEYATVAGGERERTGLFAFLHYAIMTKAFTSSALHLRRERCRS